MIIGLDFFGFNEGAVFNTINSINKFYRLEIQKAIFDEIHIRQRTDVSLDNQKQEWQVDSRLLAKFKNSLEAGNLDLQEQLIELIRFKKRKLGDLGWMNVEDIAYSLEQTVYSHNDKYTEAGEIYEYAITPVAFGGFEGDYVIQEIECEFESTWLLDKLNNYKLMHDLEYGDIETIIPSNVYEPLGSEYPIVSFNGSLKFRRGTITCKLVSDATIDNGDIDVRQEKLTRKTIMNFLTNKKPKILKDGGGNYMLVSIINNPRLKPLNQLGQLIYDVTFDFVEVGNALDDNSLINSGLK